MKKTSSIMRAAVLGLLVTAGGCTVGDPGDPGDPTDPSGTTTLDLATDGGAGSYQGCWLDDDSRALPVFAGASDAMTPAVCRDSCSAAGYEYSGVQWYTQCFCGRFLGWDQRPEEECDTPCAGDPGIACGGTYRNSIYYTKLFQFDRVRFYRDVNWAGDSFDSASEMSWVGYGWNDQVSSIEVPPGYGVTLYEDANYEGRQIYIAGSIPDLSVFNPLGTEWNDRMSSFRVSRH